jgi:hypothetical protein
LRSPDAGTLLHVDRAFVIENVVRHLGSGLVDGCGDVETAAAKAFGVDVAVLIREESVGQQGPEAGIFRSLPPRLQRSRRLLRIPA